MLKIKDNRNNKEKRFEELESGAVFCFCDIFYIKINEIINDEGHWFNAVSLPSGNLNTFDDSDEVGICCNVELVIND